MKKTTIPGLAAAILLTAACEPSAVPELLPRRPPHQRPLSRRMTRSPSHRAFDPRWVCFA